MIFVVFLFELDVVLKIFEVFVVFFSGARDRPFVFVYILQHLLLWPLSIWIWVYPFFILWAIAENVEGLLLLIVLVEPCLWIDNCDNLLRLGPAVWILRFRNCFAFVRRISHFWHLSIIYFAKGKVEIMVICLKWLGLERWPHAVIWRLLWSHLNIHPRTPVFLVRANWVAVSVENTVLFVLFHWWLVPICLQFNWITLWCLDGQFVVIDLRKRLVDDVCWYDRVVLFALFYYIR